MKKRRIAALAVSALVLAMGLDAFADTQWRRSPDEVGDSITIYTTMDDGQQAVVEDVWYSAYPDCEIEWIKDSMGTLAARVRGESSNPQCDIICGGLFETDGDEYRDCLDTYKSVNYDELSVTDPDCYYTYQDIQYMCLVVNTSLEKKLGITIDGYKSLLDPALSGKIILADPTATSSGFRQLQTMLALMGDQFADDKAWGYVRDLLKNGVVNSTSSSEVYKLVMSGEYVVGLSYESIIQYELDNGAQDIRLVYPAEGNTGVANGSGMVKNCPHRSAAEAFLDMCGSVEFQQARAKANCARGTNKEFTYGAYPSDKEIGVVKLDCGYIAEHRKELLDKWTKLYSELS